MDHLRQRRFHEATEAFRRAVALAPSQPSYHGALGWAIYRCAPADPETVAEGLAALRRAVELDSADPWVHVSLARFYAETGQPDQAMGEFEVALRINPALTDVQEETAAVAGRSVKDAA